MKKKLVAFLIGILMVVSLAGGQTAFAASEGSIQNGDIVIFGSYPQTKVTDSALIQQLNNKSKTWKKYPYYSKNTNSSNSQTIPTKQDITMMEYADVSLNGTMYRAVKIHKYRPIDVTKVPDSEYKQQSNGYVKETVYYFAYEPIRWIVLDKSSGLLLSEKVLDAQPFNAYYQMAGSSAMSTINDEAYASNYYYSTVRHWLNADSNFDPYYGDSNFLNTAFSSQERKAMKTNTYAIYAGAAGAAIDYVFLLDQNDANSYKSRFTSSDNSDYAEAQGMSKRGGSAGTPWFLSTYSDKTHVYYVQDQTVKSSSTSAYYSTITSTQCGIRPAIKVNLSHSLVIGPFRIISKTNSSTGKPYLDWDYYTGAYSYKVYRCPSSSNPSAAASWGSPIATLGSDTTEYNDPTVETGRSYYYKVEVTTSYGSETSPYLLVQYPFAKPVIKSASSDTVTGLPTLSWDRVENADAYTVYRAPENSNSWTYLTTIDAGSATTYKFTDEYNSQVGNKYKYKIRAISDTTSAYDSPYSAEKTVRCILARPTGVETTDTSDGKPLIKWNKTSGAYGYRIQYKKTSESEWTEKIVTSTQAVIDDAQPGSSYNFRLTAIWSSNTSDKTYESGAATGSFTCAYIPAFTKQPEDYVVFSNATQIFPTVQARGKGITYRWYFNRPKSGQSGYELEFTSTNNMYSLIPGSLDDGATFYVTATDKFGRIVVSKTAEITVLTTSGNKTASVGDTAKFTVSNLNPSAITSYQWQSRKDAASEWANSGQPGAKTATLKVNAIAGLHNWQFRCVVTIANGKQAYSYPLYLTVVPKITKQPSSVYTPLGDTAKFTIEANGKEKLTYQWQSRKNSSSEWSNSGQPGAKTPTLSVATIAGLHGWQFRCVVTDGNGQTKASNPATLSIVPKITTQPKSTYAAPNSEVKFTVAANGKEKLTYQWQSRKNASSEWTNSGQPGAKTATLTVTALSGLHGWQFRCVVTDGNGQSWGSNAATLFTRLGILKNPVDTVVAKGATAKFTVTAYGKATLKYQWQSRKNSSSEWTNSGQPGAKTATLSVTALAGLNGWQFRCIVTDGDGKQLPSKEATLTVK
ncbi:MAG: fibronectin type III domain-containing protein [Lachnospiraceae bacterium]|nr:fibronectin type III domain-containing protein [Lachnospiraceae bacterium]